MYKSFRVKNFRCFKDLRINDLGRVNLIAGKNNTGKTALMEAMYIHSGNRDVKTLLRTEQITYYRSRDSYPMPRDLEDDAPSIVNWSDIFYNFDSTHCINLSAEVLGIQQSFLGDGLSPLRIERVSQDSERYEEILNNLRIDFPQSNEGFDVLVLSPPEGPDTFALLVNGKARTTRQTRIVMKSSFSYPREKTSPNVDSRRFSQMRIENVVSKLINALKVFDSRLSHLEFLNDGTEWRPYADIGLPRITAMASMGDGINRFFSLLLEMSDVPSGVIFIDEIENGIHHSVQKQVWQAIDKLARDLDIQVFATTHSLEMIRAAYEAFSEQGKLDEFRYHRLDRDHDTGDIDSETYNELDLDAVASFDFDFEVRG